MGALCVYVGYLRRLVNLFFLYVLRLNDLRLKVYLRGGYVAPVPLRFLMKHLRLTYGAISDFCEEKSALYPARRIYLTARSDGLFLRAGINSAARSISHCCAQPGRADLVELITRGPC